MDGRLIGSIVSGSGLKPESFCDKAGVSMGTYYKIVNNKYVKPSTKFQVEQTLIELGLVPKPDQ